MENQGFNTQCAMCKVCNLGGNYLAFEALYFPHLNEQGINQLMLIAQHFGDTQFVVSMFFFLVVLQGKHEIRRNRLFIY